MGERIILHKYGTSTSTLALVTRPEIPALPYSFGALRTIDQIDYLSTVLYW